MKIHKLNLIMKQKIKKIPESVAIFSIVVMIISLVCITASFLSLFTKHLTLFSPQTGFVFTNVLLFYSTAVYTYL